MAKWSDTVAGEVVLTRLVSYIVVEVEKTSRPFLHAPVLPFLKERETLKSDEEQPSAASREEVETSSSGRAFGGPKRHLGPGSGEHAA
eukprot:1503318-Amphidinium_carterae.1